MGEILLDDMNLKDGLFLGINAMILIDILLVAYLLILNPSAELLGYIVAFDTAVCIVLLTDFIVKIRRSASKAYFLKHNIVFLIAILPLELIFPIYFIAFRLILFLKLVKISGLVKRHFINLHMFFENTKLDKIIVWIVFVVIVFTFALYFIDPSLDLFDSLWYVVVTLTTVGYGDVTPNTFVAKLISILLLIMGIFIFSTLTGAISSYFTDKILNIDSDVEEELDVVDKKIDDLSEELKDVRRELEISRAQNQELHDKLDELLKR